MSSVVKLIFGKDGFARLTLSNPAKHNVLSAEAMQRIGECLDEVKGAASGNEARALFIESEGKSFCAGADLEWMKKAALNGEMKSSTHDEAKSFGHGETAKAEHETDTWNGEKNNFQSAMGLGKLLNQLATLPIPTVALVQGPAFGGGVGLVACCDIAVGVEQSKFVLSEVKLGLIPATISPYVVRRIGANNCRRYFLTAEAINAHEAHRIGLLHEVVSDASQLGEFERKLKERFRLNGPASMAASKALIDTVEGRPIDHELMEETARLLASQRKTDEAKEGIEAFFQKRPANFVLPNLEK